jgi:16S rRNA (guanine527-N7)-methyltransferase
LELTQSEVYSAHGLDAEAQRRLALLGDLTLAAGFNATGVKEPAEVESIHFLDSLSLLALEVVSSATCIVDIGSGAGLPALVLALARPGMHVTALESQRKKCSHIDRTARALDLNNVSVCWARAEDHARSGGLEAYDVAVSRAVASLAVVAEYSLPLLRIGGVMVAMKGAVPDQERTQVDRALGILGGGKLEVFRLYPFTGCRDRSACVAEKIRTTPSIYPRRAGIASRRPLGLREDERPEEARH